MIELEMLAVIQNRVYADGGHVKEINLTTKSLGDVYINPDTIAFVTQAWHGYKRDRPITAITLIGGNEDNIICVAATVATVIALIEKAKNK